MANILSFKEVADYLLVTLYTKENHAMLVLYREDKAYRFPGFRKGLFYINVSNLEISTLVTERGHTDYYFLSTVNVNMEYFNRADIEGECIAHDLLHLLGWPSDQQFINTLSKNLIINYPVLLDDARHVHAIYGQLLLF